MISPVVLGSNAGGSWVNQKGVSGGQVRQGQQMEHKARVHSIHQENMLTLDYSGLLWIPEISELRILTSGLSSSEEFREVQSSEFQNFR